MALADSFHTIFFSYGFGTNRLIFNLLLVDIPTVYTGDSIVAIAGQLSIAEQPDADISAFPIEINFDFALNPNQTVTPDSAGLFSTLFDVGNLTFPDTGEITFTVDGEVIATVPITTPEANPLEITTPDLLRGSNNNLIVGSAPPLTQIIVSDSESLFPTQTVVSGLSGAWSIDPFVIPSNSTLTTTTITAVADGQPVTLVANINVIGFAPTVSLDPFATNTPTSFSNPAELPPNENYLVDILNGTDLVDSSFFSTGDDGSYNSGELFLPPEVDNIQVDFVITRLSTGETATIPILVPDFDMANTAITEISSGVRYSVDAESLPADPNVYLLQYDLEASPGYEGLFELTNSFGDVIDRNTVVFDEFGESSISITVPVTQEDDTLTATLTVDNHNTVTAQRQIDQGFSFRVQEDDGRLLYPGLVVTLQGKGEVGSTITVVDGTSTLSATVDGNGDWSTPYTILPTQTTLVASNSVVPDFTLDLTIIPTEPAFTTTCPTNTAVFGGVNGSSVEFSGTGFPGRDVDITITGVVGLGTATVPTDNRGIWRYSLLATRQDRGTYTVVFQQQGFADLICSSNFEPGFIITPASVNLAQGEAGGSITVDTLENALITSTVQLNQITTDVPANITTNNQGSFSFNYGDTPILTDTPSSGSITLATASGTQSASISFSFEPRVPIVINAIPNGNAFVPDNVLFTNSTYTVTGDAPSNGILSLSSIGGTQSFVLDDATNDSFSATLVTNSDQGTATLTASTILQPPGSSGFRVSEPISFTAPPSINAGDPLNIVVTATEGQSVSVQVSSTLDGEILNETAIIDSSGNFTFITSNTVLPPQVLTVRVSNSVFSFDEVFVTLNNDNFGGAGDLQEFANDVLYLATDIHARNKLINLVDGLSTTQVFSGGTFGVSTKSHTDINPTGVRASSYLSTSNYVVRFPLIDFGQSNKFTIAVDVEPGQSSTVTNYQFLMPSSAPRCDIRITNTLRVTINTLSGGTEAQTSTLVPLRSINATNAGLHVYVFDGADPTNNGNATIRLIANNVEVIRLNFTQPSAMFNFDGAMSNNAPLLTFTRTLNSSVLFAPRVFTDSEVIGLFNSSYRSFSSDYTFLDRALAVRSLFLFSRNTPSLGLKSNDPNLANLGSSSAAYSGVPAIGMNPINNTNQPLRVGDTLAFNGFSYARFDVVDERFANRRITAVFNRTDPSRIETLFTMTGFSGNRYVSIRFEGLDLIIERGSTNTSFDIATYSIPLTEYQGDTEIYVFASGVSSTTDAALRLCVNGLYYAPSSNQEVTTGTPLTSGNQFVLGADSSDSNRFSGSVALFHVAPNTSYLATTVTAANAVSFTTNQTGLVASNQITHVFDNLRNMMRFRFYRSLSNVDPGHEMLGGTPTTIPTPAHHYPFSSASQLTDVVSGADLTLVDGTVDFSQDYLEFTNTGSKFLRAGGVGFEFRDISASTADAKFHFSVDLAFTKPLGTATYQILQVAGSTTSTVFRLDYQVGSNTRPDGLYLVVAGSSRNNVSTSTTLVATSDMISDGVFHKYTIGFVRNQVTALTSRFAVWMDDKITSSDYVDYSFSSQTIFSLFVGNTPVSPTNPNSGSASNGQSVEGLRMRDLRWYHTDFDMGNYLAVQGVSSRDAFEPGF